jgi:hypothetical protein
MKLTNIAAYVAAKETRLNAPGRITNGQLLVLHNGQWVSREDFYKATPEPSTLLKIVGYKGVNSCTKVANIS